jgi:hypothetical protein
VPLGENDPADDHRVRLFGGKGAKPKVVLGITRVAVESNDEITIRHVDARVESVRNPPGNICQ